MRWNHNGYRPCGYRWPRSEYGGYQYKEQRHADHIECMPAPPPYPGRVDVRQDDITDALKKNLGNCVEIFTAADDCIVGVDERIGTIVSVCGSLLKLVPRDCDGDREVYFDIRHVIGFQVSTMPEGHEARD